MPRSADVLGTVQGDDPLDTYARQIAAFDLLSRMIRMNELVGYHTELLPMEKELLADYATAAQRTQVAYAANAPTEKEGTLLRERIGQHRTSAVFKAFIIQKLLGPAAREAIAHEQRASAPPTREQRNTALKELSVAKAQAAHGGFWGKLFGPGGAMLGFGVFIFLAGVGLMRSTKESGLAAVGFVCLLVGVVLFVAGLSEFWDLVG